MSSPSSSGPFPRFANLQLRTKGALVVAVPVCALLAGMGVFFRFEQQTRRAATLVQHSYEIRSELRRVLVRVINAETGLRGYLLTGRDNFLEPYWAARRDIADPLGALRRLESDDPPQMQRIQDLEALVHGNLGTMEQQRLDAAGGRRASALAHMDAGKTAMDELRHQLSIMETAEQRDLVEYSAGLSRAQRQLEIALVAGGALGLIGGFVAVLLFTTGIVRRVNILEDMAHRVADGQPVERDVSGRDEIARLGRTLSETSQLLAKQREQLQAAQSDLEARVTVRTAELRAANEEVRQSNQVRQVVIQSSPLAIWAIDLEGRVTLWNPAAERIFGWSEAEVMGRRLPVIPPDGEAEFADWLERFRSGHSVNGAERVRQTKDGTRLDALIWTAPLRDASGRIEGTITVVSDETQRKILEEQFRQSQKLEAVGRLAGGVAHDFNNLLTVITGYSELLVEEIGDELAIRDYAAEIQEAASRAGGMTAQLLAFSRRQISQPRVLDLNEVVARSMKMLRRLIGEDLEIATHLDPGAGRIKADPTQVDQIMMNLVVNARDAMAQGGKLTIETAATHLDEEYSGRHIGVAPGAYTMLAISDTGCGMDAETRRRIFEPFFTTKEAGKGTGLGLSIVYGIVKQNGGEVIVYSEPGQGTSFKIYFPVADESGGSYETAETAAHVRGHETILLCEDEERIRHLVHTMLAKHGYRVLEAAVPEEALRIVREEKGTIHLLFTDIVMPKLSGFELARQVKELLPGVKVLYMSGYTDNQMGGNWVLDPETPFIQKPFTAAGLVRKVRDALENAARA